MDEFPSLKFYGGDLASTERFERYFLRFRRARSAGRSDRATLTANKFVAKAVAQAKALLSPQNAYALVTV